MCKVNEDDKIIKMVEQRESVDNGKRYDRSVGSAIINNRLKNEKSKEAK